MGAKAQCLIEPNAALKGPLFHGIPLNHGNPMSHGSSEPLYPLRQRSQKGYQYPAAAGATWYALENSEQRKKVRSSMRGSPELLTGDLG
jgi:hypothetical protein